MKVIFLFIFICLVLLLFFILRFIYYYQLKLEFKKQYKVDYFPKKVKIHRSKPQKTGNYYTLNFPVWTYANKDGTRDKRRNNNSIHYPGCNLYIDQFHVIINNPLLMIRYVNVLRKHNAQIGKNKFEEEKEKRILNERKRNAEMGDLNNVINRFKDNPYEFESYCAQLYRLMGIDAKNTSNSNDGGYDIILNYENGEKGLVECKCYNKSKIGRPLIQKLVGANQTVGAKHLIFITTSDYSEAAKEYAQETGVELIDGVMLMNMIYCYIKPEKTKVIVNGDDWSLCDEDIKEYIPKDIYVNL
ncbi:MAG: restriction endonuclease [Roseburia sp.]|nr:restriction endonuclease [Roseburia sp.]